MAATDARMLADREAAAHDGARLPLKVWLRLLTCASMIEGVVRARLHAQFATTLPRFDVLAALDAAGDAAGDAAVAELTMGELSARLMVTSGNVTGLINAMEKDGLVVRRRHPADRRSTLIGMTEPGRALFARMAPAHAQWIEQVMVGLDRTQVAQLWEALGQLKASALGAAEDTGTSSGGGVPRAAMSFRQTQTCPGVARRRRR